MAETEIEYLAAPTRWERWRNWLVHAGIVFTSHLVGVAATLLVFVGLPLLFLLGVLLFLVVMILCAGPGDDAPPPIMVLAIPLVFLAVGVCAAPVAIVLGVVVDTVRRALRWPWWTGLVGIALLCFIGATVWAVIAGLAVGDAALRGVVYGALLTALFCVYWIPMTCAEGILRILKWGMQKVAAWWKARRERQRKLLAGSES